MTYTSKFPADIQAFVAATTDYCCSRNTPGAYRLLDAVLALSRHVTDDRAIRRRVEREHAARTADTRAYLNFRTKMNLTD